MWLLWLHTACPPWLTKKAAGPSERWECFAIHYSDKDLKIEKAFVTLKLAKHCTLMSKTTNRIDPGLSLQEACRHFCSLLRWHEEFVKWQATGGFGRLMWVITGSIPLSRDTPCSTELFSSISASMPGLLVKHVSSVKTDKLSCTHGGSDPDQTPGATKMIAHRNISYINCA